MPIDWANIRLTDDTMIGIGVDLRERKRAEETLRKNKEKFELLSAASAKLLSLDDPFEIIKDICERVLVHLNCQVFFNYVIDEEKGRLHLNAYSGIPEEAAKEIEWLNYGEAVCGFVALEGTPFVCGNIPQTQDPKTELIKSFGIKAYACYPLMVAGKVIGTLSFGARTRSSFSDEELLLIETVADQVTIAKERTGLIEELRRSRDTLELKVQERTVELAQANELLEKMFSSVDLAIAYMDRDFNFTWVNRAYAEADGHKPEFFVGKNHFALFPNRENERIFRRVVKTGKPYSVYAKPFEYAGHPERGVTYWDWSLQSVKDASGRVTGVILSLVDVTDRVRAEESVRRNEALLQTVFETLPVGVWLADEQGRIVHGNPAGQKIWAGARYVGLDRLGEYKGWWAETGERVRPEEWGVARAIKKGETSLNEEIEIECFDGSRKIILNSAVPIRDKKNEIIGAFVVNEDITERKKTEQHFRQMQKMEALGTLAGGIAHDFNNILMPIIINTEMAFFDTQEGTPLCDYLQQILDATKRGKDLVNQIIAFSRQRERERKIIRAGPIIEETVKFLRSSLPGSIEIHEGIETDRDTVRADPTQLHQVLMNLCSNSGYAMRDRGGNLDIKLSYMEAGPESTAGNPDLKPGAYVRLTVSDDGCGMTKEVMERIFDPFFTTKKPGEGTGMGLSVVHGIVKDYGGSISVASEPDKGTVFDVFLPLAEGGTGTQAKISESLPAGSERILLVEDEEAQLKSVRIMLERLGYRVLGLAHSEKALDVFRQSPQDFDLVITDQTMPCLSGEKLALSVLRIRPDIPVILYTGFSEMIDAGRAKTMGIAEFMMKPFTVKEMAEAIRRVLQKDV